MTSTSFTEETDPFCLATVDAAAMLFDAPWQRYAVIGDSLSAGTGDKSVGYGSEGWSDRFAHVLRQVRPDLAYLNTAVIGATTVDTLDHQIDEMRDFAPDLLHLPCGANDLLRRSPDFGEIEQNMRKMYGLAAETGAQLTTFTLGRAYVVPVFPDWTERVLTLNDLTRAVADEYDAVVVDMWDHPVNSRENLLSADRIHFSTSGQAVIASEMVKALAATLARRTL
ncbi:SGNH/GDSL hydrolase family protein [Streptomyces sp. TRM S81-3]|uniref:SGNH/GDSL hydrolase family protein n=1 Tax=Streptomyces griseicoloratus TaxID=2752516 RepID=A0A926KYS7_9ACTN|nr:SGNH/GDSL hydrolase family protein [Streptomyces griseicoloratus]MBD0419355.1 SGNH/GDSL hydrolase family protein [Streptomyces griseicoloratus]